MAWKWTKIYQMKVRFFNYPLRKTKCLKRSRMLECLNAVILIYSYDGEGVQEPASIEAMDSDIEGKFC